MFCRIQRIVSLLFRRSLNFKKGANLTNLLTHFSCHASEIKECVTNAIVFSIARTTAPQEHLRISNTSADAWWEEIQQEIQHRKYPTRYFIKLKLFLRNQYTFNSF